MNNEYIVSYFKIQEAEYTIATTWNVCSRAKPIYGNYVPFVPKVLYVPYKNETRKCAKFEFRAFRVCLFATVNVMVYLCTVDF
jgi:hypothetical protein